MLHSGSRGVGNRVGSYFIELAKNDMRAGWGDLPEDEDLAYLCEGTEHFDDYVDAMTWAQDFASANRRIMMNSVLPAIEKTIGLDYSIAEWPTAVVDCHHNYASRERHFGQDLWLTRKGAVDASLGKLGIIPGSMGAKSFIVRGRGQRGLVSLVLARRRPSDVSRRGQEAVLPGGPRRRDRRRRVSQGLRRHRRDAGRVQGHRRRDGTRNATSSMSSLH